MCPDRGPPRAARVLFVANDGLGSGHVTRAVAIARALKPAAQERGLTVERLLFTTAPTAIAERHRVPAVRAPAIGSLAAEGLEAARHRALVTELARATIDGFRPDLTVIDTFPAGPHRELSPLLHRLARTVLVRRTIAEGTHEAAEVTLGIERMTMAVVPDDPTPQPLDRSLTRLARVERTPPIVLAEAPLGRKAARAELGVPERARVVLVTAGGGGDPEAIAVGRAIATTLAQADLTPVLLEGPLAPAGGEPPGVRLLRGITNARVLAAFDAAFAAAGYNTAHELAAAGVPTALFARPRPFDDQAARAERFAAGAHARVLPAFDPAAVRAMLARLLSDEPKRLAVDGAIVAARAILTLLPSP